MQKNLLSEVFFILISINLFSHKLQRPTQANQPANSHNEYVIVTTADAVATALYDVR